MTTSVCCSGVFGLTRERRDDVVGFLPFDLHDRNVENVEHLTNQRELRRKSSGMSSRFALYCAKSATRACRPCPYRSRDDVRRLFIGDELIEHHREAVDGVESARLWSSSASAARRTRDRPDRRYRAASNAPYPVWVPRPLLHHDGRRTGGDASVVKRFEHRDRIPPCDGRQFHRKGSARVAHDVPG